MTMRQWTRSIWVTAFLLTLFATGNAAGGPIAWVGVGLKGGVGGNYLSMPDKDFDADGLPFNDGGGGLAGGGGVAFEARFLKQHLGLEIDFLADVNRTWCNIDHSINDYDIASLNYIMRYTSLRIPILAKAGFVSKKTRGYLGIGPEFILGLGASKDVEVTDGYPGDSLLQFYKDGFNVSKRNDVALAWELAFAFAIKKVDVTLDFRFAYHATYPKTYQDRAHPPQSGVGPVDVEAGHSIDMHILLGAAYNFVFGRKK